MEAFVNNDVPKTERPELRAVRRRRVLKGGVLTFNNGLGAFEAVVRNQSDKRAMLIFGDATGVPASFDLAISGGDKKQPAQVRWRSMNAIGVEFV